MNRQGAAYTLDPKDLDLDFSMETVFNVTKQTDTAARIQNARALVQDGMMSKARALQEQLGYEDGPLILKEAMVERAMEELMPELIQDALAEAFPLINERIQREQSAFSPEQLAATNPALAQVIAESVPPGGPGSEAAATFLQSLQGPQGPAMRAPTVQAPSAPQNQSSAPLPPVKGPVNGRASGSAKRPGGPRKAAQPYTRA